MSDSKDIVSTDKSVTVKSYTRKPPAMRGFDKVTVQEKTTRTITYEKKPRR